MLLAYKAFNPDLSCTSGGNHFQYVLNSWNEEPKANCRENGFHCAENPLDCLAYYPVWEKAVYYLVAASGDIDEDDCDSKISCTRLRLIKQLNLEEFVTHSLNYIWNHPFRRDNRRVRQKYGMASNGFAIVRGKNPRARGHMGDVLGFIKEEPGSRRVKEMGIYIIDGKELLPDIWYNIYGKKIPGSKEGAVIL